MIMNSSELDQVRVLLIDDHPVVRTGLRYVIEQSGRLLVVGEGKSGRDAVRLAGELRPDVVVMDISMPEMNGLEATRLIKASIPETRVLIVSTHLDSEYVRSALDVGADGYLLKHCHPRDLYTGIVRVHGGERVIDQSLMPGLIAQAVNRSTPPAGEALSEREREVLQLLAEGSTSKEIAVVLGLKAKTVENHRARILDKLGVTNSAAAVRVALSRGFVSVGNGQGTPSDPATVAPSFSRYALV
jgi:DNA-binding NarL/FixJ family response regulator